MSASRYAELQVSTHFSFLRGASSCDELFATAKALGLEALGVVDRNSLAGMVRAHVASRDHGVRLVVGCRLDLADGTSVLVYPTDRPAYSRLCRLLTTGKKRAGKGKCELHWQDLEACAEGLVAVLVPDLPDGLCELQLRRLKALFGDRAYVSLMMRRRPGDKLRIHDLVELARAADVATVATNDVLYHQSMRRPLQDVMTCIRHNCTIDDLGFKRERFADRYMKRPAEMARLFADYPEALARTLEIVERCRFSLAELTYQYPEERQLLGMSALDALKHYVREGAARRYPEGVPQKVEGLIAHELSLIDGLGYAPYFLTVHSIVRFARGKGILCQGRGSAANSTVCYVLGITSIDPTLHDLLFERFISQERNEPPDIDVDFEHERREEVIQWIYETYGRDRAALTAVVTRYRTRGALRDVGKALGLPEDMIRALSGQVHHWHKGGLDETKLQAAGLNFHDRRVRLTLELAEELEGMPRHLSQHPGGFVLTNERLDDLVPIEPAAMDNRQVIEWDKDDIDVLKFMKMDVLGLGMMTCLQKSFDLLAEHKGQRLELADVPVEDPRTYKMIQRADTLGVFQIESRAQMAMLPRIKPRTFYDLVIEVAIIRPGPIQGDMVHPYLRRREGKEPVTFPRPELERVLGKTLGVPLFQEQAMRVAIECAGFTPGEADLLRRAMATFKFTGGVSKFRDKLIDGMVGNGYPQDFAEKTFKQIEGFGSYGFPESHAASFALLAYASSWIKCWHPDVFCCALLNSQPMGFYAPAQIVRSAQEHGVDVRPIDINASRWDCTLEPTAKPDAFAVRLGFRLIKGLANAHAGTVVAQRMDQPFRTIEEVWRRANVPTSSLVKLAEADAFAPSFGIARRDALWKLRGLKDKPLPLFEAAAAAGATVSELNEPVMNLRAMTEGAEVVRDYGQVGLTLRRHPVSFIRGDLRARQLVSCSEAMATRDGRYVRTAGMVLVRQQPGTASGVIFITAEDETGVLNAIVWPKVWETYRQAGLRATLLQINGTIQREGEVVHLIARSLEDLSDVLASISDRGGAFPATLSRADEFRNGGPGRDHRVPSGGKETLQVRSRDFQ